MYKQAWFFCLLATFLTACGGGGGGGGGISSTFSLSGTAAVGAPIVNGTISIVCAKGNQSVPTKTDSGGSWTAVLSGQALPCAVQISGGTINGIANATSYHSIAVSAGTVNVTPLTDLLVANMAGTADPGAWFAGLSSAPDLLSSIKQPQVDNALTNLNNALPALPLYAPATNPITASFAPVAGNAYDDMLVVLQTAMTNAGVNYAAMLGSMATSNAVPPFSLQSALKAAYQSTNSGNNVMYFPVNAVFTAFNTSQLSITMTGSYNGKTVTANASSTPGPSNQTFLGQSASVMNYVVTAEMDGAMSSGYSTSYFSVTPFKNLGDSSSNSFTVYANQIALPSVATIGSSGGIDTGTDYTDSAQKTILDTFVETWSLTAAPTEGTAYLCERTEYTAVASSANSGSDSLCLTIDTSGHILGIQIPLLINGTNVTLSGKVHFPPPTVVSTSPANFDTSVGVNSAIGATFNRAVDPTTLTNASFTLSGGGGLVAGMVSVSPDGLTAIFKPSLPLAYNAYYTATLTTDVKNMSDSAMSSNYSWSFNTAMQPTVTSVSPSPYVYPVATDSVVKATFNIAMDPTTVTGSTFTLKGGSVPITGTVSYNGNTATFTPSSPLVVNTVYTATLSTGIKDLSGGAFSADYLWTFQTFAPGTTATTIPFNPPPAGLWQPAPGSTPASGNYVYLQSDPGDYIGHGQTIIFTPLNSALSVTASGGLLSVNIAGNSSWSGNFQSPNSLSQLMPGYYPGVLRYPFNNPVLGGLSWYGDGRGCNTLLGWFTVDNIAYINGVLAAIDLRFEQQCEQGTTALHGAIHWAQ